MRHEIKTLALTSILTFLLLACGRQGDNRLFIILDNTAGLTTESEITANGLKIGSVDKIDLFRNKIIVTIIVDKKIHIPENSIFRVERADLLGSRAITVTLDSIATKFYTDNDTIYGQVQKSFFPDSTNFELDSLTTAKLKPLVDTFASAIRDFGNSLGKNKKK